MTYIKTLTTLLKERNAKEMTVWEMDRANRLLTMGASSQDVMLRIMRERYKTDSAIDHECSNCGMPERATRVLGFACEHERCPMIVRILGKRSDEAKKVLRCETWEEREEYLATLRESEAVKKAMRRFWRRLDEINHQTNHE